MKSAILAVALVLLASPAAQAACTATATRDWAGLKVEASAAGPDCKNAVVTLALRKPSGEAVWAQAHIAAQLLNFSDTTLPDAAKMKTALGDWISGSGFMQSADKLVEKGEFHFVRSEALDAKSWAALRKAKRPVLCYVQGMESGNCLALGADGEVVEIGYQMFPG